MRTVRHLLTSAWVFVSLLVLPGLTNAQGTWELVGSVPTTNFLYDIWGTGPDNVYAVGSSGTLLHFDGSAWSIIPSGTTYNLRGIWGSSAEDIFVVCSNGKILHYDGVAWAQMVTGTYYHFMSVWGTGPNDVFAAADYGPDNKVFHFDGTGWAEMANLPGGTVYSLWGAASDDVYLAATSGRIFHYNGTAWSSMTTGTSKNLSGLWGEDAMAIFAVGSDYTILNYNGVNWTRTATTNHTNLSGVGGSSSENVFAVGSGGLILYYDGTSWSPMTSPTTAWLWGVWMASEDLGFAVGASGTILRYQDEPSNSSPTVAITTPADGLIVSVADGPVPFAATANDPEDGDISTTVNWSSTIDGGFVPPVALSVGTHTITASATDSSGLIGADTITITVEAPINWAPIVTILSPKSDGVLTTARGPLNLTASAIDPEDGDLGASVQWTSNRDGVLVSPASLSEGCHILTATVIDSGGLVASDSITVTVFSSLVTVVDPSGGGDFTTIQAAIDAATTADGDTIVVRDGVYVENVDVDKKVTIQSLNGFNTTTVAASDASGHVFNVGANDVTIRGFTIYGANEGYAGGIYAGSGVSRCAISENRFGYNSDHQNTFGIYLVSSSNHVVSSNYFYNNASGVYLVGTIGISVEDNVYKDNSVGINVRQSSANTNVTNNLIEGGNTGIWINTSNENVVSNNILKSTNRYGILFSSAIDNYVSGNECLQNDTGMSLSMSSRNKFTGNTISDNNKDGIYASGGGENQFIGNIASRNATGVEMYASHDNFFRANAISENNFGMKGAGSSNIVYLNNFIDNTNGNYSNDDSPHNRVSPTVITYEYAGSIYTGYLGNYYSDHDFTDSDGDGVTDEPYRVTSSYVMRLIVDESPLAAANDQFTIINEGPNITIAAPMDGSSFSEADGAIALSARAEDYEDGDISGAVVWTSDLDGPVISPAVLSVGTHQLTAGITDSGGMSAVQTITVTITSAPNTPPVVTIIAPANNAIYSEDEGAVLFSATAMDAEDGDLSGAVQWASSIDGSFSSPASLSPGIQTVTASVTDSGGLTAVAVITITIAAHINVAPTVSIATPSNNAIFSEDDGAVIFSATAADAEDGDLGGNVQWVSNIDGFFTSPAALSVGVHAVTASVVDSGGLSASQTITVTITAHVNVAPNVTIITPAYGSLFTAGGPAITFSATANDTEDGDLSAGVQWTSSIDGSIVSPATLSAGTHIIMASVSDSGGLTGVDSVAITVMAPPNNPPVISITAPEDGSTLSENDGPVVFSAVAFDPEDGDISANAVWSSSIDGPFVPPIALSLGTHTITATVSDAGGLSRSDTIIVVVEAAPSVKIETGTITGVSSTDWVTVSLSQGYDSMVVVCTPMYDNSSPPMVARVQQASGNSFQVKLDRADGQSEKINGVTVHYVVVEEGVYTVAQHGIAMEAVKTISTVTARKGHWTGQTRSYANDYVNPVVIGQVMTYSDPRFSAFWCYGTSRSIPPSATALRIGKHVGEDTDTTRNNETIGYIVMESGSGSIGGLKYVAQLGTDTVKGLPNGTKPGYLYAYSGISMPTSVVISQAAMDGGDGGWGILYGSNPLQPGELRLSIDEDQLSDSERNHTSEQVAFVVFEDNRK